MTRVVDRATKMAARDSSQFSGDFGAAEYPPDHDPADCRLIFSCSCIGLFKDEQNAA